MYTLDSRNDILPGPSSMANPAPTSLSAGGTLMLTSIVEGELMPVDKAAVKVYVVAYPSNKANTRYLPDTSGKPEGCGFGICIEPRKRSKRKFWSDKNAVTEPTLITVEDLGEDELTMRSGSDVGTTSIIFKVMVGESDDVPDLSVFISCMAPLVKAGSQKADLPWIMACLNALQTRGVTQRFDMAEFQDFLLNVTQEQSSRRLSKSSHGKSIDYLERLRAMNTLEKIYSQPMVRSRRGSLANAMKDKLRRIPSSNREHEKVLRLN